MTAGPALEGEVIAAVRLTHGPLLVHKLLNANQRQHWRPKAELTRFWRQLAAERFRGIPPVNGRVHVAVWISWPDQRRRDTSNWAPTGKACLDGIVDSGVLPDDNDRFVVGPDMRRGYGPHEVSVVLTRMPDTERSVQ